MKKILISIIVLCIIFSQNISAQTNRGAKFITPSQAVKNIPTDGSSTKFSIQVGLPFLAINQDPYVRLLNPVDIRNPWDILYLYNTFAEEFFTISKGYYGDKVKLEWEIKNNITGDAAVTGIKIYRRVYNPNNPNAWGQPIVNLSATATNFDDKYIEGGVLYEYKVYASGVNDAEIKYKNYITGIGFRSPTAIVTGNINYKGGNPVKDVVLVASSNNIATTNVNKSIKVPLSSYVDIVNNSGNNIDTATTLQAWVKPFSAYNDDNGSAINLFKIFSSTDINNHINVNVNYKASSKIIEVNIGGNKYLIKNYFPSGNTNTRGDDELIPVSEFNNRFTHFSAVLKNGKLPTLYINGRPISVKYANDLDSVTRLAKITNYNTPFFSVETPNTQNITLSSSSNWDNIHVGGNNTSIIDEIRVWKKALDTTAIRTDFKRYISGNNTNLVSLLNLNEGVGLYGYDLSKNGFDFNENIGKLDASILWMSGEGNVPTSDQLGILGVTDAKGNYEITNIPYTGVGESYTITPMFGQHKFEAKQQLVYLGQGSEVANKIDFTDVSSFSFKGVAMYDSRGVFPSYVEVNKATNSSASSNKFNGLTPNDEYVIASNYDSGYNYYLIRNNKYRKGEYWFNDNGTNNVDDDYLERFARIYVKGANVYVDGNIVLDDNNLPVETDEEGKFDVSVPIGNHAIYLKKEGHSFLFNGRFPSMSGTYKEFFENSEEPVVFVDTTKITVVGKVVGGAMEAAKKTGFGENGFLFKNIQDSTNQIKTVEISAKNNIGIANLTLGYKPNGAEVTNYTRSSFNTNAKSGEYRVQLLPLLYELKSENLVINSNNTVSIIPVNSTESLNFTTIPSTTTPIFKYKESEAVDSLIYATGKPYHYEKSFIYRTTPILQVLNQTSNTSININGVDVSIPSNANQLVYSQFGSYQIDLKRYEQYVNKDSTVNINFNVPVSDGQLIETNNLAISKSTSVQIDKNDQSILHYTFKAGIPNIAPPFTKTISLKYRVNNIDYDVQGLKSNGIILGGASDGSQTFVTSAPDIPAIILRDPPGSNSSAQITKGTSFTVNSSNSLAGSAFVSVHESTELGFKTTLSGGLVPVPEIQTEAVNNLDIGVSLNISSKDGKSKTSTYTFNKTISTSDQTNYVGSDGDIYFGNSKNIYYGSYDNVRASTTIPLIYNNGQFSNMNPLNYINIGTNELPIYICTQKAISFIEKPTNTFFMYSQKHILKTLIPEYQTFINANINNPSADTIKLKQYLEQIRLWKAVILDNEKKKYLAKNYREKYKNSLINAVKNYKNGLTQNHLGYDDVLLTAKLKYDDSVQKNLEEHFAKNISVDAGVGKYNEAIGTSVISSTSFEYNVNIASEFEHQLGFKINETGFLHKAKAGFSIEDGISINQENTTSTNIDFTILDSDPSNYLSIDVINAFDGNGPVFSTLGGRTSCPYEGSETSRFFPEEKFASYFSSYFAMKDSLDKIDADFYFSTKQKQLDLSALRIAINSRIQFLDSAFASGFENYLSSPKALLGFATQKVEVPLLSVTNNNITNVPDGKNAEFELKFNNNSAAQTDATFRLRVDNTTNPNNALINIDKNGTIVNVPYGKTTVYKMTLAKSISDIYEYKNIKVILESLCDGESVSDSVRVSAEFVPACTSVNVSVPASNWVYNKELAFNVDRSSNPLLINVTGYNTAFANFKQIDLEYRLSGTPNWNRLKTYYNSQAFYDASTFSDGKQLIGQTSTLSYAFDIPGNQLIDGNYEIRARSTCTNGTTFISEISTGKVDLNAPQKFGTPTPIDGILGIGEDLKVAFNEPISYNTAVSLVEIKGQTNQMKIDHNVSVNFEGANNTMTIANPKLVNGSLTIEFWMKNSNFNDATIVQQKDGFSIRLANGSLIFSIANSSISGLMPMDNLFHHYSFVYNQSTGGGSIYSDDRSIGTAAATANYPITNNESIIIGGNTFTGNIHDFRIWNKVLSLTDAYAKMYNKLTGNEPNLVGYWPMTEGTGVISYDNARFKHAVLNTNMWDIKPKGSSYSFENGQYLKLDHVTNAVITNEMDATISFWMKTNNTSLSTLLSNGKGDSTDVNQGGGFDNKWAIQVNASGNLIFNSEGNQYTLVSSNIADNNWHHIALLLNRQGALNTYVDANHVSSNNIARIGGFVGNRIWIGARGYQDMAGIESVDQTYSGKLDEIQIWNTLRTEDQVFRDRNFEIAPESIGLLLYLKMNQPDVSENVANTVGPKYYVNSNSGLEVYRSLLNNGNVSYTSDAPAIKPERVLINFNVKRVISGNEMILTPEITDAAAVEGQTLDITVNRMFDAANNMQMSPITWTAYYRRNDIVWYADGYNDIVDIVKYIGDEKKFDIVVLNKGGVKRTFNISNIPRWLSLSTTNGTIAPNSKMIITATIDKDYATGEFIENMNLSSDFGYDEKLQIKLRILAKDPGWAVNTSNYTYSSNIIGRLKINHIFSNDIYNQVAAFRNDTVVGVSKMIYNEVYKQYYIYLTIYSNNVSGDVITFKAWDASEGKIKELSMDGALSLVNLDNDLMGNLSKPVIFENTTLVEQNIAINKGWTWVSMSVNDPNFANINLLTSKLNLETGDRIINGLNQEVYSKNVFPYTWSGSISSNGGLSTSKMYKMYITNPQTLTIKGTYVDLANWSYPINLNWNWLPNPLPANRLTADALAYFNATEGDIIKSQTQFAVYDLKLGWTGTLKYLEPGKGYMIKSALAQTFTFPKYLSKTLSIKEPIDSIWKIGQTSSNTISTNASTNNLTSSIVTINDGVASAKDMVINNFSKYTQNMNAIVKLPSGFDEVQVFDEQDVLKGIAKKGGENELAFVTIFGDKSQNLHFFVNDGIRLKRTNFNTNFINNELLGTLKEPIVLNFADDQIVKTFPNPFTDAFTLEINSNKAQKAIVSIYSLTSQLLFNKEIELFNGTNSRKIDFEALDGVYLLKLQMDDQTYLKTIIKSKP